MLEIPEPHSSKNWKAGFSISSVAALTSEKSFSCNDFERSSTENGMLSSEASTGQCSVILLRLYFCQ